MSESNKTDQIELTLKRNARHHPLCLPTRLERWDAGAGRSLGGSALRRKGLENALKKSGQLKPWRWPESPVCFVTDPHADPQAFVHSLSASGCVRQAGKQGERLKLTDQGRNTRIIIGGDLLDKGPSNLGLLRTVRRLMDTDARLTILAGNHDMRLVMGLKEMARLKRNVLTEHLFVRMGAKVVPLLREIKDEYLKGRHHSKGIPGNKVCRKRLFPSEQWFDEFPRAARKHLSQVAIQRELVRMHKKAGKFEQVCDKAGLSLQDVYACAVKGKALFVKPGGEFGWFIRQLKLAQREGSFLFLHAGVDDVVADLILNKGVGHLNRRFRALIQQDLFGFYYGPLGNVLRTKYRKVDLNLSAGGIEMIHKAGVHVVVHGHKNRHYGQRLNLRKGLLHLEGDTTMDCHSRRKEKLGGCGAGVTLLDPAGYILGISTDYPYAKLFEPATYM